MALGQRVTRVYPEDRRVARAKGRSKGQMGTPSQEAGARSERTQRGHWRCWEELCEHVGKAGTVAADGVPSSSLLLSYRAILKPRAGAVGARFNTCLRGQNR